MSSIRAIESTFHINLRSVQELIDFDRTVLDAAVQIIDGLRVSVDQNHPALADRIGNAVQMLRNVRTNDSMRSHYETIYNQCVVLLVSHFGSALHSIFRLSAPTRLASSAEKDALKDELKFSLAELNELDFQMRERIGDLLVSKRDISFQDMQSTRRAFKGYLGVEIGSGAHVNNIILAQAARNAIVHSGAVIDVKFVKQVSGAKPRDLKLQVAEGERLAFVPAEVEQVASNMREFVANITRQLDAPPAKNVF